MAVLQPQSTGDKLAARPPFDHTLSRRVDSCIIRLEAAPPPLQRVYRLHKRYLELRVPAFTPNREVRHG